MRDHVRAWVLLPLLSVLVGCVAPPEDNHGGASADALASKDSLYYQRELSLDDNSPHVLARFTVKKWGFLPADVALSLFNVSAPEDEVAIQRDELISGAKIPIGTITLTRPATARITSDTKTFTLGAIPDPSGSAMHLYFDSAEEFRWSWAADGEYTVTIDKTPAFFSRLSMTLNATWQPFQP